MNKQKFNSLLKNYSSISEEDLQGLQDLANSFPYSQILHTLVAKANHNAKTKNAASALNRAAMYATDRQLLKSIILESAEPIITEPEPIIVKSETSKTKKEDASIKINQKKQVYISVSTDSFSQPSDLLRDEIWLDLKHLKESKANYLDWLEKSEDEEELEKKKTIEAQTSAAKKKPETLKQAISESVKETKKVTSKASTKKAPSKKNTKKVTAAKNTAASVEKKETSTVIPAAKKTTTKASKPKIATKDTTTDKQTAAKEKEVKKKAEVKSKPIKPPLEEQIKIIDSFIDKKPSISSRAVKTVESDQKDLSVGSTVFGEDLVSENLAQILVEQGKNEKAIDIYKKLIWKFPQKKSYFAAQIEALTK